MKKSKEMFKYSFHSPRRPEKRPTPYYGEVHLWRDRFEYKNEDLPISAPNGLNKQCWTCYVLMMISLTFIALQV
jgi:hypothetical protein